MLDRGQSRKIKKELKQPPLVITEAPEIRRDEIEELDLVGTGQYGEVYRGRCRGYDVAIKILKRRFSNDEQLANFKREVSIMSRIRFPNVCLLLGACTDPDYFCILQEYLQGGDLGHMCEKKQFPKSFYARMRLGCQIARGMVWIHSNSVLHRDLKLENLLIDKYGEVKVCDFGLADYTGDNKIIWDEGRKGSPLYMAPEVLMKKGVTTKVDVYAFGLILWEILAEQRVFQHHLQHNDIQIFTDAIVQQKERPPIPPPGLEDMEEWKDPFLVDLLQRTWADHSKERPSFSEIYDELNTLIVDGLIKDQWGRIFWLVNFPDEDNIPWDQFVKTIKSSKAVELQDGSSFCRGLAIKENETQVLECLKLVLAHVSGIKSQNFTAVNLENFGKLLAWFGPGLEPQSQKKTFIDRIMSICSQPWFHGNPDNPDGLASAHKDMFLVRLSTTPGFFTVQHNTWKVRIEYVPEMGFRENNFVADNIDTNSLLSPRGPNPNPNAAFFPDLVSWVNDKMVDKRKLVPMPNSEFQSIFQTSPSHFPATAYLDQY